MTKSSLIRLSVLLEHWLVTVWETQALNNHAQTSLLRFVVDLPNNLLCNKSTTKRNIGVRSCKYTSKNEVVRTCKIEKNKRWNKLSVSWSILPAQRYASAGTSYGPVSVCRKSEIYQNGWTNRADFWHGSFLPPILYCVIRISPKIRILPSWTLSQTPDLPENSASACRSSKRVINLARQGGRSERDKLDCRRSTKLTIPPSSDSRPVFYHSDRQALYAARFRRAGLLDTVDTCILYVRAA